MNFIKIDFTDVQLNNLLTFIDRISVKGINETIALSEIIGILVKAEKEMKENSI